MKKSLHIIIIIIIIIIHAYQFIFFFIYLSWVRVLKMALASARPLLLLCDHNRWLSSTDRHICAPRLRTYSTDICLEEKSRSALILPTHHACWVPPSGLVWHPPPCTSCSLH